MFVECTEEGEVTLKKLKGPSVSVSTEKGNCTCKSIKVLNQRCNSFTYLLLCSYRINSANTPGVLHFKKWGCYFEPKV